MTAVFHIEKECFVGVNTIVLMEMVDGDGHGRCWRRC